MSTAPPRTLTIAGSDSGGGAGIQADLKTFQELDTFGMSVLTALTAQNSLGVHGVHEVPPAFVRAQLDAVLGDIGTDAVKLGMLSSAPIIAAVAEGLQAHRSAVPWVVVDPVAASKHGDALLRQDAVEALRTRILPLADVVTPNTGEVAVLTGLEVRTADDLLPAAEAVKALGPRWVLVKGGHLPGDAVDLLFDGERAYRLPAARLDTVHTHGTGCTLAAAIAAHLARGADVVAAVRQAKGYVTGAIRGGFPLGAGIGPVDHAWRRRPRGVEEPSSTP